MVEKDLIIYNLWKYLIQCSPQDIESLPDVPNATRLTEIQGFSQLCQEEMSLIGFCCNGGSAIPKNVSGRHNFNSWNKDKIRIAKSLYKIKHWNIVYGDYFDVENKLATWFIDPPYQNKGKWYRENKIDYSFIGNWCKSRLGEVIVCENVGVDWLDFKFLKDVPFTHFKTEEDLTRKTQEGIWYNLNIGA